MNSEHTNMGKKKTIDTQSIEECVREWEQEESRNFSRFFFLTSSRGGCPVYDKDS